MRKQRTILVLSATAGAGHVRAGEALAATARELSMKVIVRHEDVLEFTSPLFKRMYSETYTSLVQASPDLWGALYRKTEFKGTTKAKSGLMKLFDQFNYRKYLAMVTALNPDAVLCTHFLPYAAIAGRLRDPSWTIPYYAVPTDYAVHSLWVNPSIRRYYVATEEAAWSLTARGVPRSGVKVTGIPVAPEFSLRARMTAAREAMELPRDPFTIMVLSGGYGMGFIQTLVPELIAALGAHRNRRFHLLLLCGKNPRLLDAMRSLHLPPTVSTSVFAFIPFVDRLMDCADLLITKSGGLTVSEALSKRVPMLILDPIPGQESRNADYLVEQGAAVRAADVATMQFKLNALLGEPSRLAAMRRRAGRIARPSAAEEILRDVLSDSRRGRTSRQS